MKVKGDLGHVLNEVIAKRIDMTQKLVWVGIEHLFHHFFLSKKNMKARSVCIKTVLVLLYTIISENV